MHMTPQTRVQLPDRHTRPLSDILALSLYPPSLAPSLCNRILEFFILGKPSERGAQDLGVGLNCRHYSASQSRLESS
jgi:hypothetical protein